MKDLLTHIVLNEPMTETTNRLRVAVDWPSFDPGQFVMIDVPGNAVFLRRPFGIVGLDAGVAEICYKVVGKGTEALSVAPVGASISVLGPCGSGFKPPAKMKTALLVAGGYGIGPLFGLASALRRKGVEVRVFYGGRNEAHLLYLEELKRIGASLHPATEDGSLGHKGFVTELLEDGIKSAEVPALFACGPHGLLEETARIGISRNIPTQVSMEAYMACGLGVCQGCVCKDKDGGFVRTCSEGPVFDAAELAWN